MQDTPAPSPRVHALLDDAATAAVEARTAHGRLLRSVDALREAGAAVETGHRSTTRLLAEHLRLDRGEASSLLKHSALVVPHPAFTGGPAETVLPATSSALEDGAIGPRHVAVLAAAMRTVARLPHLDPSTVAETERQLVALARARTPGQLDRAAVEILLRLDPDGRLEPEPDRPDQELHLATSRDGVLSGKFRFADPESAETLRTAIDALTPPPDPVHEDDRHNTARSIAERRAAALAEMAADTLGIDPDEFPADEFPTDGAPAEDLEPDDRAVSDLGVDGLGIGEPGSDQADPDRAPVPCASKATGRRRGPRTQGGDAVHLTVTVPLEVLEQRAMHRLAGFGLLDGQWALTPEAARRLACDAAVIPAVLGARGEILDLGRKTRVISTPLRRAVIARDRHCAHPGCRRRPRRCQVHHIVPWSWGGRTDLDNLVLTCAFHHYLLHHSGWEIHMRDGVPIFIPPAWLDPLRRPRTNRAEDALPAS